MEVKIRYYCLSDEENWLDCHKNSYYESFFFDELLKIKPRYETPSIELVALYNDKIVGILDIEIEEESGQLCFKNGKKSGIISVIGVKPQYRRKMVATKLLNFSINLLRDQYSIFRLEIWIRNDNTVLSWLNKNGFTEFDRYYQMDFTSDFFEKFDINLPFVVNPILLRVNADTEAFSNLIEYHSPEKTERIILFEKFF
ncbi:MAG: GNAT family N-acetyltransferase [Candidatus Hodarchaeota archaeon]